MIAEISGKVNRQNTNLSELSEDELTGNFFGSLRYIPFDKGMKNIHNAFEVVNKTHENVNNLIEFCKLMVNEKRV